MSETAQQIHQWEDKGENDCFCLWISVHSTCHTCHVVLKCNRTQGNAIPHLQFMVFNHLILLFIWGKAHNQTRKPEYTVPHPHGHPQAWTRGGTCPFLEML